MKSPETTNGFHTFTLFEASENEPPDICMNENTTLIIYLKEIYMKIQSVLL
jgi:hypothetical protein